MGKEIIYADRKDFTLVTSDIKVVFGKGIILMKNTV